MKKVFAIIIVLSLMFFSCKKDTFDKNGNTTFNVELHHSHATNVFLVYVIDGVTEEIEMSKVSDNQFEIKLDIDDGLDYLVNIKVTSADFPDAILWVGKAIGIDAINVSINNISLTDEYLVKTSDTPSAAFSIQKNADQINQGSGDKWNPDSRLPAELTEYHNYCRLQLPPAGFAAGLPWMQALHNGGVNENSMVEVDYLRFYAHTPLGDQLLFEDDYLVNMALTGYDFGGTFLRYPFFYDEENNNWAMPAEIANGNLIIHPDSHKDRAFHWWTSQRILIPADAQYVFTECRVKITGDACVQLAMDFWKDLTSPYAGLDVNNTESGVSDFIFKSTTNDWQVITFSTENLIPWVD
jgi:hypothetical protein